MKAVLEVPISDVADVLLAIDSCDDYVLEVHHGNVTSGIAHTQNPYGGKSYALSLNEVAQLAITFAGTATSFLTFAKAYLEYRSLQKKADEKKAAENSRGGTIKIGAEVIVVNDAMTAEQLANEIRAKLGVLEKGGDHRQGNQ